MPQFTYTGEDKKGKKVTKKVTADDRFAVYAVARNAGHTVLSVEVPGALKLKFLNIERLNYLLSRVKDDELIMATRNLGSMLKDGLTITRAFPVIQRQTANSRS